MKAMLSDSQEKPKVSALPRHCIDPRTVFSLMLFALALLSFDAFAHKAHGNPTHSHAIKPGAAVKLAYDNTPKAKVGEGITVDLSFVFSAVEPLAQGSIVINAKAPLHLHSESKQVFDSPKGKKQVSVTLSAIEAGRHYFGVFVTTVDTQGHTESRVFEVPINVGSEAEKQMMKAFSKSEGLDEPGLHIMQAEESIK